MRSILLSVIVSITAACATTSSGPRPINVHAVRVAIAGEIDHAPGDAGPRAIISMGKVTADSAVVYTERDGRGRHEEVWVKIASTWKLQESRDVTAAR